MKVKRSSNNPYELGVTKGKKLIRQARNISGKFTADRTNVT